MKMLSVNEVSKMLGVHRNTILNYIRLGKLEAFKVGPINIRIREEEVEKLLISMGKETKTQSKKPEQTQQ